MKCQTCKGEAHPTYGDQCEDCWALHQRPSKHVPSGQGVSMMLPEVPDDVVAMSDPLQRADLEFRITE